ncbi:hypothetical protein ORV05_31815 [Amycolatopsis cynarae]|uniref:Glycosyltransferase RgtA/B/C/D-like domain-containing protein n=1 Tax=Amycolatopsis cynarae TaxID=2995223 RepID=A0ABY7B2G6_9PSEU|nr:hypothetical protein [Amycolatopsis sp. HUAS 11-8]WAL65428.1 hypothetical protein ORV05_31815 [Amycolatopsis sp. HUAS 11-8]
MLVIGVAVWLALAATVLATWPRPNGGRRGLLLLALAFALLQELLFGTVPDRAFVTFRYAENIANGHGAVFNVGERVEGYSNFTWLVLITFPKALFGANVVTSALVLSVLCVLGCVLLAFRFGPLAGVLTAGVSGLAAAGQTGTETALFVLLVLAVIRAVGTGHPIAAGVFAALALMTRPDGVAVAFAAGLWLVADVIRHRANWWRPTAYALGLVMIAAPWLTWRATYYSQPLARWPTAPLSAPSYGFLLATLAALLVNAVVHRRRRVPSPVPRRGSRLWAQLGALALCGVSLLLAPGYQRVVHDSRTRLGQTAEIGSWLAARVPPESLVDTGGAQALAYVLGDRFRVLDERADPDVRNARQAGYANVADYRRPAVAVADARYLPRQRCDIAPPNTGSYRVATFRRAGGNEWVTVYSRGDEAAELIHRLATDSPLVYVPCPGGM